MSRDEDKLIRQLSLLSFLLSRPRPFSVREIRDSVEGYWDMSDDTFARRFYGDRADLEKIGIEIRALGSAESADSPMYCLLEEDYRLPSLEFTPAERHSLALALATLDGRFAYARPLRLALTAISRGEPDPLRDELEQLPVALAPDEDVRRAGRQLARLEQAASRGKTVCFLYPSTDGGTEERTFDPYSLFLIQGRWYAVGFDHRRQAIRTFRLARIEGTVRNLTEKTRDFAIPADYDPAKYRARPPWLIGPVRGTATIKVDEDLSWWVERLRRHVVPLREDDDGCTVFKAPYADADVLLSWVVGLGGCGEKLLAPDELRALLRRQLEEVRRAHEKPVAPESAAAAGSPTSPAESAAVDELPASVRPRQDPPPTTDPIAPEHLARTLALLRYLVAESTPDFVSWEAFKADLGLSRAEVEADLTLLNLMNFGGGTYAVMTEAGDDGVAVTRDVMADTFVHPSRLSPLMARALLLAIDLLGDAIALEGAESLASVRAKVERLVGDTSHDVPVLVDDLMVAPHDVMAVLNTGIREHRVVEIDYFTPSRGELTTRRIEPYLLFRSRDGWYVEAYCLRAAGQRTFKTHLIRAARPTDDSFQPRDEVDLTPRRAGLAFNPGAAEAWASIRFAPRWRTYLEDRGLAYRTLADGTLAARVPYLDQRWMAREVVRFLGGAILETPPEVRERVAKLAADLAARYASSEPAARGAREGT